MRLFAAIVPPAAVLDHLATALDQVIPRRAGQRDPLLPRSNWHITLAFFGQVPSGHLPELAEGLAEITADWPSFELELAGAGSFSARQAWIGVGGDVATLKRLMSAVGEVWFQPTEDRPRRSHRPHLTFSRAVVQGDLRDQLRALTVYRGPSWTVTSVDLLESKLGQGAGGHSHYAAVASAMLL